MMFAPVYSGSDQPLIGVWVTATLAAYSLVPYGFCVASAWPRLGRNLGWGAIAFSGFGLMWLGVLSLWKLRQISVLALSDFGVGAFRGFAIMATVHFIPMIAGFVIVRLATASCRQTIGKPDS